MVLILIVIVALPVAGVAFALGAGKALGQIGKGDFAIEQELPQRRGGQAAPATAEQRQEEIRQMVQARSHRREARGDEPLDVDAEVEKLLAGDRAAPSLGGDRELREEVRQLVVARNERRARQGKPELDVDSEIDRQLRELEGLGQ